MRIYRISKSRYAHDHSGRGASLYGGRWNSKNIAMIYASGSIALAALEILAHLNDVNIRMDYSLITYDIPEKSIYILSEKKLPRNWQMASGSVGCQIDGDDFINKNECLCMKVPSVIIPQESNFLINPNHDDFVEDVVESIVPFLFDKRIRR